MTYVQQGLYKPGLSGEATEASLQKVVDSLINYKLSDIDKSSTTKYLGYTDKDGNWYITQIDASTSVPTFRYIKGTSSYSTNWTARASLTYDYFANIF